MRWLGKQHREDGREEISDMVKELVAASKVKLTRPKTTAVKRDYDGKIKTMKVR